MTTIELTDDEAMAFVLFQQHRRMFQALIEAQVHDLKRGEAVLSFNPQGNLMKIEIRRVAYRNE